MRSRGLAVLGAAVIAGGVVVAAASAQRADAAQVPERRADVALVARPAAVEFPASGGSGTVRLAYSNPGNVPKVGGEVFAEIPAGITVSARPAPGWECHLTDWPTLVCSTETTLNPGELQSPAEVVLTADAALSAEMEFGTLGFYRDPTENPADNYSTVTITATA